MIFYGTKGSIINSGQVRNIICPLCNESAIFNFSVYGRYAHIYWIPFFPIKKICVVECQNCKLTYDVKKMPENVKTKFETNRDIASVKTPITHFSLTIVFGLGIIFAFFQGIKTDNNTVDFAKNPKVGDIWHFKARDGSFGLIKVDQVRRDSVFVTINDMVVDAKTSTNQLNKPEYFTQKGKYRFSRLEIVQIQVKDTIFQIDRN